MTPEQIKQIAIEEGFTRYFANMHKSELQAFAKRIAQMQRENDSFDALVDSAKVEAKKAMQKFPQPNYVISKIAEESGEVVGAAIHYAEGRDTVEHVRKEMTQALAMMYRLWVEGDQVHGCPPIRNNTGE